MENDDNETSVGSQIKYVSKKLNLQPRQSQHDKNKSSPSKEGSKSNCLIVNLEIGLEEEGDENENEPDSFSDDLHEIGKTDRKLSSSVTNANTEQHFSVKSSCGCKEKVDRNNNSALDYWDVSASEGNRLVVKSEIIDTNLSKDKDDENILDVNESQNDSGNINTLNDDNGSNNNRKDDSGNINTFNNDNGSNNNRKDDSGNINTRNDDSGNINTRNDDSGNINTRKDDSGSNSNCKDDNGSVNTHNANIEETESSVIKSDLVLDPEIQISCKVSIRPVKADQESDRNNKKSSSNKTIGRRNNDSQNSSKKGLKLPQIAARTYDPTKYKPFHPPKKGTKSEDDLQSNTGSQINNSQLDTDTKAIFKVAKQLAQPDDVFIKHLVRRSHKHRLQIKKRFRELYDLDLIAELKSGLGNEWNPLIDALLKERNNSSARSIHDALEIGDYSTAVEILFSCKNADFPELRESYRKEYAVSLENDIHDKTEDSEQALLMVLQTGERDEGIKVDEKLAEIDANDLYESGDGRWSSDTGKFMKMLKVRNNKHIKVVLNLYKVCNGGMDATQDIKRECSRNYAEALTTLINCLRGSENHYADALFRSMSATDPTFVNLLVLRSEIDIPAVRRAYKKKYDAELVDDIRHKCVHRTTTVLMEIANRTPPNYPKGKTPQQRKWGGANTVTHTPRQPVKRPERQKEVETKSKHNPLAQPSMRVAADTVAMRKEEDREKQEEKERKREHERQKKNISGTIKPATNFNPVSDCERLHDTLSKHDTDETVFIDILPSKSNSQRQILKRKYQEKYHKNLTDEMNSRISGDFEEIVLGLMMTPAEYDAHSLHEALDGFGVTESTLIGILCTRDSVEMKEIKEQYKKAYKTDLVQDLQSETSDLTELLVALSKGERDQAKTVNLQEAQKDAKKLYRNGEIAIDTKDAVFINLLVKKNHSQVKATFQEYEKLAGHDMYQGISNAMLEDAENGYIAIARAAADPTQYFAERLEMCFSGIGTNDNALIRIIVSRSEIDLRDIKARYQQLYGKSLSRMIKDECSGDYKQMLLAILGDQ